MSTFSDIQDGVFLWVGNVLPDRIVQFENQNSRPPESPYATILFSGISAMPYDVSTYDADAGTQTLRNLSLLTIKLSIWDGAAMTDASRLKASVESDNRLLDLWVNMGRAQVTNVLDLTSEYLGRLRPRAEFSVSGYATLSETFAADCFDSVDYTIEDDR